MYNKIKWALIAMILSSVVNAAERDFTPSAPAPSRVFGWVEKAVILPGHLVMNAKMDTGALTSSLDAKGRRFSVMVRMGCALMLKRRMIMTK